MQQQVPQADLSKSVSMPAQLLIKFERALGVDGAYRFFNTLTQEQVDAIVNTALHNEWISFTGNWHE